MHRGRNKTPAERALEVICTMAGIPFNEFEELLRKSQNTTTRDFPECSYNMVKSNYFKNSSITQKQWEELYQHITNPKTNYGN